MKKLLFFLSFLIAYGVGQAQNKVIIKSQQVSISSLAPITGTTVLGNPNGSPGTPQAIPLGYGIIFSGGKLAVDSATLKDTVFGVEGLRAFGAKGDSIGLGGRFFQDATISGANAYALTFDSFPTATNRGFRVNFGSDAGWDMIVRDSVTGFWKRIPKGTVGQVWTMLGSGGVGWGAGGGGGGSTVLTRQNITSGTSATVTGGNYLVQFNFASVTATYTLTLPASPADQDIVEIQTGRTITANNPEITNFTLSANAGQFLNFTITPSTLNSGETIKVRYNTTGTFWDRLR